MHGPRWQTLKTALMQEQDHYTLSEDLIQPYYIDYASVLAARELDVQPGNAVLDLCAAPGGKSLIIAGKIGKSGLLVANDVSRSRRARLSRVLHSHLPEQVLRNLRITGFDGRTWCLHEQNRYDRILVDAPCSSERHVLHSLYHLKQWTPARTRHLSMQAYTLLVSALTACLPGGIVLYCTCTVSYLENDEVIRKLSRKKENLFIILKPACMTGEPTEFGLQIWPDQTDNMGPIYISKLKKSNV